MQNFDESYTATAVVDGRPVEITVSRNERAQVPPEDRSFVIGGETFVYRTSVAPERFKKWSMMVGGEYVLKDERGRPILDEHRQPVSTLTEDEALVIYDETILAFLEPGQEEKWKAVRAADAANPLNLEDIKAVMRWLFDQQTGRPTGRPSGSSSGSATVGTGTTSTGESDSPAEPA